MEDRGDRRYFRSRGIAQAVPGGVTFGAAMGVVAYLWHDPPALAAALLGVVLAACWIVAWLAMDRLAARRRDPGAVSARFVSPTDE